MLEEHQYKMVKVVKLRQSFQDYDGWKVNQRPPQKGDVGCLIDVLHATGLPNKYVVEKIEPSTGITIWLADFWEDELELIDEDS
jgi:hypothetical protein